MPRKGPKTEEQPLTREQEKFCAAYCRWRDIYKAAEKSGIAKNRAVTTFNLIQVQEEIERQREVVRQERARQQVEVEILTNEFLDKELISLIKSETGSLKKESLQLGYVVTGRIQAGMTRILEVLPNGDKGTPANFYQAFVQPAKPAEAADILPPEEPAALSSQPAQAVEPRKPSTEYSQISQKTEPAKPDRSSIAAAPAHERSSGPPRKAGKLVIE
jgi:hypothetical protein